VDHDVNAREENFLYRLCAAQRQHLGIYRQQSGLISEKPKGRRGPGQGRPDRTPLKPEPRPNHL